MFQKAAQVAEYAGMAYGVGKGMHQGWGEVAPALRGAAGMLDRLYEDMYHMPFPEAAEAAARAGAIF